MYGRLGRMPRHTKSNRVVRPPTEAGQASRRDWTEFDNQPSVTTTFTQDVPTVQSGDLLVWWVCSLAATHSTPSGWTLLDSEVEPDVRSSIFYRVSDGSEGSSQSFTLGSAVRCYGVMMSIAPGGVDFTANPPEGSIVSGNTFNPPAVSPSGTPNDFLVFAALHWQNARLVSSPTGYVAVNTVPGSKIFSPSVVVAEQLVTVATAEDPDAFTMTNTSGYDGTGSTVAVLAASSASVATGDHTHTEDEVDDITTLSQKATPVDADRVKIYDSEDSDTFKWSELGDLPGGGGDLDGLSDVTITTPADNEVLAFDNGTSEWINQTATEAGLATSAHAHAIDDLTDVDTTTDAPTTGQVLKWDGSNWVPDDDDTGSGSLPSGTTKGDLAVYNGTSWVRIGAGANDTVLTADSAQTEGIKWAAGGGGGGGLVLIEEIVLGSAAASVTFSAIPGTLKDLLIVYQARSSRSSTGAGFRIRVGDSSVDTGSNYIYNTVQTGAAGGTGNSTSGTGILTSYGSMTGDTATADFRGGGLIWFIDYADTSFHRQVNMTGGRHAGADVSITEMAGAWKNTADVIDTIELAERDGNNLLAGSRFALYGTPA
jgi:hypothetical protein